MVDLQLINYVLNTKDYSIITLNNLDVTYFPNYAEQFEIIRKHYEKYHIVPDKATLLDHRNEQGKYPFEHFDFMEVNESTKFLVEKIKEEALFVKSVNVMKEFGNLAQEDSRRAVEYLQSKIPTLTSSLECKGLDIIHNTDLRFNEYLEKTKDINNGYYSTGFPELDEIFGGWDKTDELAVISARTGVGKTWWAIFFLMVLVVKYDLCVGLYSGEMSKNKVGYRFDTLYSNMSNYLITHGNSNIKSLYETLLKDKIEKLKGKLIVITPEDFGGIPTVAKLKAFCENNNLQALAVDQLSLIADARNARQANERLANISTDMKVMQNELKIPIFEVSQLNRTKVEEDGVDARQLSGSDRIGQDATTIIALEQKPEGLLVKIVKARNGKTGDKLLYDWDIDKGKFTFIPTESDATKGKYNESTRSKFKDKSDNVF